MQFISLSHPRGSDTRLSYQEAREIQLDLVEQRYRDLIPDTVLFLEHRPVITQGRGLQWTGVSRQKHMPVPGFLPEGLEFSESERGGDLTYHGPGQLVIYPICKLDGKGWAPHHDVGGFLRKLESTLIEVLRARGLNGLSRPHSTGVWVDPGKGSPLKKIASVGIAVRKWVTFHGLALNCVNDLSPFHLISPCGLSSEVMTRLSDWSSLSPNWRQEIEESWVSRMVCGEVSAIKRIPVDFLQAHLKGLAVPCEWSHLHEKHRASSS